jgi:hypothetical protein
MVSKVPSAARRVGMSSLSEARSSGKPDSGKARIKLQRTSAVPRGSERLRGFRALKTIDESHAVAFTLPKTTAGLGSRPDEMEKVRLIV